MKVLSNKNNEEIDYSSVELQKGFFNYYFIEPDRSHWDRILIFKGDQKLSFSTIKSRSTVQLILAVDFSALDE